MTARDEPRTVALRYLTHMQSGEPITAESIDEDGPFPVYGGNGRRGFCDRYTHDGEYVLIGRQGAHCGNVHWVRGKFWASEHAVVTRVLGGSAPKWFMYLLRHLNLNQYSVAAAQPGLAVDRIRGIMVRIPTVVVQRRIADFLDRKTASIDTLIAKQEQLLGLLAEKRQGLITQAVTKGLDPHVPMKDSGNSLLGLVPSHWYVCRIGHVALVGNGSTPRREEERYWADRNSGFPWLNSAKTNDEEIVTAEQWITDEALRECHLPRVPADCVVVAITGEGQTRGRAALLHFEATISQHLAFIRPQRRISASFLCRQLQAFYRWLRDESAGGGSTRAALTCEFLRDVPIVVPPLDEQERIVSQVRSKLRRLDGLAQRAEAMIEKLREYRQALITAAVTGQLDIASGAPTAGMPGHPPEVEVA